MIPPDSPRGGLRAPFVAPGWDVGRLVLMPAGRPLGMGIVNLTPDSFYPGSRATGVAAAVENGAEGIGLLRTELIFMAHPQAPDEATQEAEYRRVLDGLAGRPLVVRTLDVGGDKPLPYWPIAKEENPFLGVRVITKLSDRWTFRAALDDIGAIGLRRPDAVSVLLEEPGSGVDHGGDFVDTDNFTVHQFVFLDISGPVLVAGRAKHRDEQIVECLGAVECVDRNRG